MFLGDPGWASGLRFYCKIPVQVIYINRPTPTWGTPWAPGPIYLGPVPRVPDAPVRCPESGTGLTGGRGTGSGIGSRVTTYPTQASRTTANPSHQKLLDRQHSRNPPWPPPPRSLQLAGPVLLQVRMTVDKTGMPVTGVQVVPVIQAPWTTGDTGHTGIRLHLGHRPLQSPVTSTHRTDSGFRLPVATTPLDSGS